MLIEPVPLLEKDPATGELRPYEAHSPASATSSSTNSSSSSSSSGGGSAGRDLRERRAGAGHRRALQLPLLRRQPGHPAHHREYGCIISMLLRS